MAAARAFVGKRQVLTSGCILAVGHEIFELDMGEFGLPKLEFKVSLKPESSEQSTIFKNKGKIFYVELETDWLATGFTASISDVIISEDAKFTNYFSYSVTFLGIPSNFGYQLTYNVVKAARNGV